MAGAGCWALRPCRLVSAELCAAHTVDSVSLRGAHCLAIDGDDVTARDYSLLHTLHRSKHTCTAVLRPGLGRDHKLARGQLQCKPQALDDMSLAHCSSKSVRIPCAVQ